MKEAFLAVLNPMVVLFLCIVIGFVVHRTHLLPENAGKVMAKMLTWIFYPALAFMTMATYCTVDNIKEHAVHMALASFCVALAVAIALCLSPLFVPKKCYERGVYNYALAFANSGYLGDPLVQAIYGGMGLAYYKLYCLPLCLVIYTWGVGQMVPADGGGWKGVLKKLATPPNVAMLAGIVVGLLTLPVARAVSPEALSVVVRVQAPLTNVLNTLKACMGPVAMILAGFTVAAYSVPGMLKIKKVYAATFLRLLVIPAVIIAALFGVKSLVNLWVEPDIGNLPLFLCFFSVATPLGLNTIIFPEAYGGDPEPGASMALVSNTLGVISLPLLYALMAALFGTPVF